MFRLREEAISGVFWSTMKQFSSQGVGFIVSVILARLLEPEDFGLIAMIGVLMGLGNVLVNSGLAQSLIRTKECNDDDYSTVFIFNLISSALLYVLLYISAPFVAIFYDRIELGAIIRLYGVIFIINALGQIHLTILTKEMDFKAQMMINLPALIISGGAGIYLALKGFGVWSLVYQSILYATFNALLLWMKSSWKPKLAFDLEKFKYHFVYGSRLALSGVIETLFSNLYLIIIGKFYAPKLVGYYNRAETLNKLPAVNLSTIINQVSFPLFSRIKDNDSLLKNYYSKFMEISIFISAPLLIFMAVTGDSLFRLIFTEKWVPAVPYFQILVLSYILYPINAFNLNILKIKGRSDVFLKLEIIKKVILCVLLLISLPFGLKWILYSSVVSSILAFVLNSFYSGRYIDYNLKEQILGLLPYLLAAVFGGLCVYMIYINIASYSDVGRILFSCMFGSIVYLSICYVLKLSALKTLLNISTTRLIKP